MSDDQTAAERAAFAAAVQRVQASRVRVLQTGVELQEAARADDLERQAAAASEFLAAYAALARAYLDAGHLGDTAQLGFTQAQAADMLLFLREKNRSNVPAAIAFVLNDAFAEGDDPHTREWREDARAMLVETAFVTEHELATFPPASVTAIVWDRYRAWDDAN